MPPIQLTLTLDEINQVLESLGQQPFVKVHQLIAKIQQQATAQLQAAGAVAGQADGSGSTQPGA